MTKPKALSVNGEYLGLRFAKNPDGSRILAPYRQQFAGIGEVIAAAVVAIHLPRLLLVALCGYLYGFQTIGVR